MIELFAGGLVSVGVHIAKSVWDRWWSEPDVRQSSFAVDSRGESHLSGAAAPPLRPESPEPPIVVTGSFQIDEWLIQNLTGDELAVLAVIDADPTADEAAYVFALDLGGTFEIPLWPGTYSIYAFIVDREAPSLAEAVIWGCGFPNPDPDDDPNPLQFAGQGSYEVDVFLWDANEFSDTPLVFGQIIGADANEYASAAEDGVIDMSGEWLLNGRYEAEIMSGRMFLEQDGVDIDGYVLLSDESDDGSWIIVEQEVSGTIIGDDVELAGTSARVKKGRSKTYYLDTWQGSLEAFDRVSGTCFDEAGSIGTFVLARP
jgi:hypothetical protein